MEKEGWIVWWISDYLAVVSTVDADEIKRTILYTIKPCNETDKDKSAIASTTDEIINCLL